MALGSGAAVSAVSVANDSAGGGGPGPSSGGPEGAEGAGGSASLSSDELAPIMWHHPTKSMAHHGAE